MEIVLSRDLEELLASEVESGRYLNAGEVVRDALRLFKRWSEARERELDTVRRELQVGIDELERGEYTEYDEETLPQLLEKIKARGLERLATERPDAVGD